jgi:AcrR family transcriptional regulator
MEDVVVNRTGRPGREGLVEAATRLFAERGVRGTSLQQVADAAGVTKAAVYHHFRTKDQVVEAVLEPALTAVAAIVRNSTAHTDPRTRVEAAVVGLADQAVLHRHLWSIVLLDTAVEQLLHSDGPHISAFQQLRVLLHGPDPDDRRRMMVSVFLSGLMGPALDRTSADIPDEVTRAVIIEAGRRLLL